VKTFHLTILIMAQGVGETVCQHPAEPERGRTQKLKKIRQPAQGEVSKDFFKKGLYYELGFF
jgi:hypothetical protein